MAVTLISTNGLFTRLGKIIDLINKINTHRSTTLTTEVQDIDDEYADDRRDLLDEIYTQAALYRGSADTFLADLVTLAQNTVIQMVYDDVGISPQTIEVAMAELIRQMTASADDVDASAIGSSVAYGSSNNGDGVAVVSVTDGFAKLCQYALAEDIVLTCVNDSQTGGVEEGFEVFDAAGEAAVDPLEPEWPAGSSAATQVTAISAAEDAGTNLLTNGDMETFTVADIPDQWVIDVGTAGASVFDVGAPDQYDGSAALRFLGDGAELTRISQVFDDAGAGTGGELLPNTVYAIDIVTKVSSAPAAGALRVSLQTAADVVMTDDASTNLSMTIDLTAETSSYAHHTAIFRTPRVIPAGAQFVVELTTAITNTHSLYIDEVAMAPATRLYSGGPFVGVFKGADKWVEDDRIVLTITNDAAGAFQQAFERIFGMRAMGLVLPYDAGGTETVLDTLIS